MFIPIIPKNPDANDFTCRDGEIEYVTSVTPNDTDNESDDGNASDSDLPLSYDDHAIRFSLTPEGDFPTAIIRIPLQDGDEEKVALMMQGQISRVDAEIADRITQHIVKKAATAFSDIVINSRRLGLHILPFRVFARIICPDGSYGHASPQAVMVPADYPPHPEITAESIADNTLTLSLRFTIRPQRLRVLSPPGLPEEYGIQSFVSYPIYIPNPEETKGSLGSVRSALGGNARGIRFSFLSESNMKYSVAAPEKYYLYTGNEKTGYRCSSKPAEAPDYTSYVKDFGKVTPFHIDTLRAQESDIDPLDWIADWEKSGDGYLPLSLPYIYRNANGLPGSAADGVNREYINEWLKTSGFNSFLLTRPMTFADAEQSRRKASPKSIQWLRILGLPDGDCLAVLFGSFDGVHYAPLLQFDPNVNFSLRLPPRIFHRLLILANSPFTDLALEVYAS